MSEFREIPDGLEWRGDHQVVRIEPWGADSVRVRVGHTVLNPDLPGALGERPPADAEYKIDAESASMINGAIRVDVDGRGRLRFLRTDTEEELLAEEPIHFWWPGPRLFSGVGNGYHHIQQNFRAYPDERLFGLGQHQHGLLDQKGAVVELIQRNSEVTIPFLLSNRGYGLLWNNPAVGRVELGVTGTRWVADSARQIDYWITTGPGPADVLRNYAAATGRTPMLPDWAAGFWQSKLRYRSQEELLGVAREYHARGLPLSVIVCDFFHWTHLGEWRFDPVEWPDPAAAVRELSELGVRLMVSIWPSVSPLAENYPEMLDKGLLIATDQGPPVHADWPDKGVESPVGIGVSFYDATNPEAREYVWNRVRENYYRHGVRVWWLDACEPEIKPGTPGNLRLHAGPGLEVLNSYPTENARAFYEGMRAEGETEIVSLCRSAWAGSQRYGAALWSGDIAATFESLGEQIRAGLNVAVSGIPWWTTDIGGFHGGDPESDYFRELVVRWFQYGVFCPLFRLHGDRAPRMGLGPAMSGGPNEVWSFGDEAYEHITASLALRERLRPYVLDQMRVAHETGLPPMRPVFVDFPDDPDAWSVDDQFLFGPDILVAPVYALGARTRQVRLPAGEAWTDAWTGEVHEGGQTLTADAPLHRIPVYLRAGAQVPIRE
ncbi:alpha-D-xyloside xylohydrolase [Actinoalloteichus hoggarensis]|uniref:Alpha-xylosidase n=1 Tax=Actinoalloteichus hoggarensis TaxID=1470176 RepID=A0A221VZX9_9PSEU|nr:glycoside hydrolase family 31 protein [Actinoalloteichus hoggarensis]ASO19056.1 Alpha-xylosidase [Actinoalloteichus hoggarensis]MBB5920292.1 alpha-D-xyloside xylohydrolase [Actinoalloteichus hoggarensis]